MKNNATLLVEDNRKQPIARLTDPANEYDQNFAHLCAWS
jgi:hypothetical protein